MSPFTSFGVLLFAICATATPVKRSSVLKGMIGKVSGDIGVIQTHRAPAGPSKREVHSFDRRELNEDQKKQYLYQIGGIVSGTNSINIRHHDCNNTILQHYIEPVTNEATKEVTNVVHDLIEWNALQDNIAAAAADDASKGFGPGYTFVLTNAAKDLAKGHWDALSGIFDAGALTAPVIVDPDNANKGDLPNFNAFSALGSVDKMDTRIFSHTPQKTFSFAIRSRSYAENPDLLEYDELSLAIVSFMYIGGMMTDLFKMGLHPGDAVQEGSPIQPITAATMWAATSTLRRFHNIAMNTVQKAKMDDGVTPKYTFPITAAAINGTALDLAKQCLESGCFSGTTGIFEDWDDLTKEMNDASFDPFAAGACDDIVETPT